MIQARIIPPRSSGELYLSVAKKKMADLRSLAEQQKARARRLIGRYSTWARRASYQNGYEAGLAAAQNDITKLLTEITRAYDTAVDNARSDIINTSRNLAQHIVDTALMEHPDALMRWVDQALEVLKRSHTLKLRYHPRLDNALRQLVQKLPKEIQLISDANLASADLVLLGESGGVEFSRMICSLKGLDNA